MLELKCKSADFVLHRLNIVSSAFASKRQPARHRMVYALLADEMNRAGGIHALQLTTRTPEEAERLEKAANAADVPENATS